MRWGARVLPLTALAACAACLAVSLAVPDPRVLAVTIACATASMLLQGRRQNRAVLAKLARIEQQAAPSTREVVTAITALRDDVRRLASTSDRAVSEVRQYHHQVVGQLDDADLRAADLLARLVRLDARLTPARSVDLVDEVHLPPAPGLIVQPRTPERR